MTYGGEDNCVPGKSNGQRTGPDLPHTFAGISLRGFGG